MEYTLLRNCHPLTIGQRCAAWFLMRTFSTTGTSKSSTIKENATTTDEDLCAMMASFCESWFKHFKSNANMKKGTLHEIPTSIAFAAEQSVLEFYKVVILCHKDLHYEAVSPDGISRVNMNGTVQQSCVEIKSRVASNTQLIAQEAIQLHGKQVNCSYDDEVFKRCVPPKH